MQYLSQRLAAQPTRMREAEASSGTVAGSQRARLLDATRELIAEKGSASTTIEAIVKAAGVSTATFYEHFRDKEECFVASFDMAAEELQAAVRSGASVGTAREGQVRGGLAALLAAIDAEPARARLCFVEAQKGGPGMRMRYEEVLDAVAAELSDPLGPAIVGGLAWLLRERLELGGGGSVRELLPEMTDVVLAPDLAHG